MCSAKMRLKTIVSSVSFSGLASGIATAQPASAVAKSKSRAKKEKEGEPTKDGSAPVETQEPVAVAAAQQLETWIQDIQINSSRLG